GYIDSQRATAVVQVDMELLFVSYQHALEKGVLTVRKGLDGEALGEYVRRNGGGYFCALPGVKDANEYLRSALLRV
ncbi:deferrochelatase/peroxidase EfeB, partial [Escherichia coli]